VETQAWRRRPVSCNFLQEPPKAQQPLRFQYLALATALTNVTLKPAKPDKRLNRLTKNPLDFIQLALALSLRSSLT
jgi:hypothetical protein